MNLYQGLNERQLKALQHTEGPMLILAGAGSGKTRVITHKIAWLIEEKGVHPGEILAITFTNKAANEMKERVGTLLGRPVGYMWMGTFHAMAVRILRGHIDRIGYDRNFSIYDRDNQMTVVKACIKELGLNKDTIRPGAVISRISQLKTQRITPEEFQKENPSYYSDVIFGQIYALYCEKLRDNMALDFDDLLEKCLELLERDEEVRMNYQKQFRYVFVDEYQDTNRVQYEMVKLLAGYHHNLCVVGDGDQSIYGWRGADIQNILDFERDFPEGKTILLEQNYRSTGRILAAANAVISHNTERQKKTLWSENPEGDPVEYWVFNSATEEAYAVGDRIQALRLGAYDYDDIAVLYRTNAQSRQFEEAFMRKSIPYRMVGGVRFYERKEIRDLIAYLTFVANPQDTVALERILNTPKRGIGAVTTEKLMAMGAQNNDYLKAFREAMTSQAFSAKVRHGLEEFVGAIAFGQAEHDELTLAEVVEGVLERSGLIRELREERTVEAQTRIENLLEFINVAAQYEEEHENAELGEFMASLSLLSDEDKTEEGERKVTLMTLHSAKGLEFPVVFLVGMEEGLFPSKMAEDEGRVEEERRLCYVGITRAEKLLVLSGARSRMIYGATQYALPSRFIEELGDAIQPMQEEQEIPEHVKHTPRKEKSAMPRFKRSHTYQKPEATAQEAVEFRVGDRVIHETLGAGMIVGAKERKGDIILTISFDEGGGGLKRFMASGAPLKKQ